jgi:hypothetical protein
MTSQLLFFFQMFILAVSVGGNYVRQYLTFIPQRLFTLLDEKKWMVLIFNFFVVGRISSALNSNGAFEVSVNGLQVLSKLRDGDLPTFNTIVSAIEKLGLLID